MKKINLAITGCMGRMGQQLIRSSKSNNNFRLVALTENRIINKKFNGIKPEANTHKAFEKTDVIVDFTVPKCTMEILKIASKLKKKVVIGTTGFSSKEEKIIKNYSKWKAHGVEVVFISLDEEKEIFMNFTSIFPFISFCDYQKWNSTAAKDYYVFGTPTMYLLNQKREIMLRPNSVSQMDAWVDWELEQSKMRAN